MTRIASRSGMSLIEILAVVVLVIILALLLMPVTSDGAWRSRQNRCAKNLSQLMGACVAYAQQEMTAWPAPWVNTIGYVPKGQAITAGVAAMNYAFGCFDVLAHEATLPNGLFRCDSSASPGPNSRAQPGPQHPALAGNCWADAGGGSSRRISYAFDWAAPEDPGSVRVVFSDRDPANHKNKGVTACFGDSHAKFLKVRSGPPSSATPNETIGMSGTSVVVGEVDNPDSAGSAGVAPLDQQPDNIFTSVGDFPADTTEADTALTPGGGDPVRAIVK
jgi:type II secretory pathway pseudopilin PulG